MQFERHPEQFVIRLSQDDVHDLRRNSLIGLRDGVFGTESKVTVMAPRGRYERQTYLRHALAYITLDPGQDITVILDPFDQPQNGFVLEVAREQLVAPSRSEVTEAVFPKAGLRLEVEAQTSGMPSLWHRVIDAATNDTEVLQERAF